MPREEDKEVSAMLGKARWPPALGLLLAALLVLTACTQARGGGWIENEENQFYNPTGEGRSSFGFTVRCRETTTPGRIEFVGELEWDDHATGVRVHADMLGAVQRSPEPVSCEEFAAQNPPTSGVYVGRYRPQGPDMTPADEGFLRVSVTDNGEPGIDQDTIQVSLIEGRYSGYNNGGVIQGGNLQVDP